MSAPTRRRWTFLSGPFDQVQHLGTSVFRVAVGRQIHTERVMLVDKWSNLRGLYLTSDPSQTIALKRKDSRTINRRNPAG